VSWVTCPFRLAVCAIVVRVHVGVHVALSTKLIPWFVLCVATVMSTAVQKYALALPKFLPVSIVIVHST